jgi:YkoY family integral membrane protein
MWGLDPAAWTTILGAILSLVLLEGLLSADNALVLAVMVRHLPKDQQKRALRFGIWGAFIFRLIAVIFASILLEFWWLKVLGGVYLLFLASRHFLQKEDAHEAERKPRFGQGFWGTVLNVEIADIAFSVDSILAAVAVGEALPEAIGDHPIPLPIFGLVPLKLVVVYIGGVLGIITMRMVAGFFIVVLERFKGLAEGAYLLVGWIGIKLLETGFVHALHPEPPVGPGTWRDAVPAWLKSLPEMPEWMFWGGMIAILAGSMLYKPRRPKGLPADVARAAGHLEDEVVPRS